MPCPGPGWRKRTPCCSVAGCAASLGFTWLVMSVRPTQVEPLSWLYMANVWIRFGWPSVPLTPPLVSSRTL
jgi:hypothetical protein